MSKLHKLKAFKNPKTLIKQPTTIGIILFAVVGTILLLNSRAASPYASLQPESGAVTGAACPITNDSTASGGSAIQFGTACSNGGALNLPRIPWEGGPAYWSKFPKAVTAGWTDPGFFPITVFYGKPDHTAALKAVGINGFIGAEHDGSTVSKMTSQGMFLMAQEEWSQSEVGNDPKVVGWQAGDECEMSSNCGGTDQYSGLTGQKTIIDRLRAYNDGRFVQTNYGNGVLRTNWSNDDSVWKQFLAITDVASVDQYMYTSPVVQGNAENSPFWPAGANPATSAGYGWLTDMMRKYQEPIGVHPTWTMVETAKPYIAEAGPSITPEQLEGADWSAIIHEARGIAYFQHNNGPECGNYSLVDCSDPTRLPKIAATNARIQALAPVLNTQSYAYNFNNATDTMLKTYNNSAYIFADIGLLESPGNKTFALPLGISGTTVTVVDENRTIPVVNGKFSDNFQYEYSHHIYKIAL